MRHLIQSAQRHCCLQLEINADKIKVIERESAFLGQAVWIQILVPPRPVHKTVGLSLELSLSFLSYKMG